jgi:peroxidase
VIPVTDAARRLAEPRRVTSRIVLIAAGSLLAASPLLPGPDALARGGQRFERRDGDGDRVSPVLRIRRKREAHHRHHAAQALRSIDGSGNNEARPELGAAGTPLLRLLPPAYADGVSALAGADRPGPREVSNQVAYQPVPIANTLHASDYLWQWGQFVDHDIDLTDGVDPPEPQPIAVTPGDPWFDPDFVGGVVIPFNRSLYDPASGSDPSNPRQQLNEISGWIDASNVYGSDAERADALRAHDGTGRLRTSAGGLLPFNTEGLPNAGGSGPELFLAGDVRANEQVGLTAMHTLFVREHNRLAARLAREHPDWDDERLYQKARQLVGAEVQAITYREFLPALLGREALAPYAGYDPEVDASISNVFSTAAYRFGHSALSPQLLRLDRRGREIRAGHLSLRDAFFAPQRITDEGGIDPLLRGLATQRCQRVDVQVVDDVRNFLFGPPGGGGFDLASLNIQRGRDHGLPSYNDAREALGLPRARDFADVSSDPETRARLADAYAHPDDVDLWVGGLAEDPVPGAHVGPLVQRILVDQFQALRDGDRFWYERTLSRSERSEVEAMRLSDVIRANTGIGDELPGDVFHVMRRRRR